MSIRQLMGVSPDCRDVEWLKRSLQFAIQLELSTIPPYLCGMWSIIDRDDPVRNHIRLIVLDEMLHMGLACNMLATLGGLPQINNPCAVPTYPGHLPGDVRPQLVVWLAGFSRAMVRAVYMEIEYPENGPITRFLGESVPTIGAFYDAICGAFGALDPSDIKKERQITEPILGVTAINSIADAECAIKKIKEQGEGTSQDPFPSDHPSDRAHYYRFAEVYYGRELVKIAGKWQYAGDQVKLPAAYPMAEVPADGYAESNDFDRMYTEILNDLQSTWEKGGQLGQAALSDAIKKMKARAFADAATDLMKRPLPSGSGNYGPSFRLIKKGLALSKRAGVRTDV